MLMATIDLKKSEEKTKRLTFLREIKIIYLKLH